MAKGPENDSDPLSDEESVSDPDNPETWPTRRRAAVILGVHVRTVDRMVAAKELDVTIVKGVKRFNPKALEDVNSEGGDNWGAEIRETLQLANKATEQANAHSEKLLNLVFEPSEKVLTLLSAENARLTTRVSELEDKQIDAIDSLQKALELTDERETKKANEIEKQKRITQAADMAIKYMPTLLNQLVGINDLSKLIKGLTDENLLTLKLSGVLNEEQYEAALKIRGQEKTPETETPNEPKKETKHVRQSP